MRRPFFRRPGERSGWDSVPEKTDTVLPTSGFTMLGDPSAVVCDGDSCSVPGTTQD